MYIVTCRDGIEITSLKSSVSRICGNSLSRIRCYENVLIETLATKQPSSNVDHAGNVLTTCYLGNDAIHCNESVISDPLLNNGHLSLALPFRLSVVMSQYHKQLIKFWLHSL
jgi:hypothetical protein